jgi:outer membrane protein assembly factor BamB
MIFVTHRLRFVVCFGLLLGISSLVTPRAGGGARRAPAGGSWPMFGGTPQRNMANVTDKNITSDWSVEEGKRKNIKWVADLGSKAFGGPVIAGGRVFMGTNNAAPRDPKLKAKDSAVLMAFNESDGKFLWQNVHEMPHEEIFRDFLDHGLVSTPTVDGDRLYYVTPACEVICAGAADGKIAWRYDMRQELGVVPFHCGNCSPLLVGDRVFLVTGNGRGDDGKVAAPKAPSFIALDKKDGKLLWQNNMPSERIIEGQWSNPVLATVGGKPQVIFPGGDNVLYALEPATGALIWKFDCNPGKKSPEGVNKSENFIIATPVVQEDKLYIGLGVYPDHSWPTRFSYFLCVDITKKGDVSPRSLDAKAPRDKNSALVWAYGGLIEPRPKKGALARFGPTMSTAAIHDGLVYISDRDGYVYCLDAKTGQRYWNYDVKDGTWGSPYYVDGKVYQAGEGGGITIFEAGKMGKVIRQVDMEEGVLGTPVAASGVLYVATRSKLYAIAEKK